MKTERTDALFRTDPPTALAVAEAMLSVLVAPSLQHQLRRAALAHRIPLRKLCEQYLREQLRRYHHNPSAVPSDIPTPGPLDRMFSVRIDKRVREGLRDLAARASEAKGQRITMTMLANDAYRRGLQGSTPRQQ